MLSSCTFALNSSSNDNTSEESSEIIESSSETSSTDTSNEESSSNESSVIDEPSSSEEDEIETVEYEEVLNTVGPDDDEAKTYRIVPTKVKDDEFTVYNVKYNTRGYLAHPTTLTIKKAIIA